MKRAATVGLTSPYFPSSTNNNKKLTREFYDIPALALSKALLGKVLARKLPHGEIVRGTIVETEAYPGRDDPASHSYKGRRTERNTSMFMEPGTSYVYFTYGMYHCVNVSSQEEGGAVLIRAVEPLEDYESLHSLRNTPRKRKKNAHEESLVQSNKKPLKAYELANGPGKLCIAFDIHRQSCDRLDLTSSDLMWVEESSNLSFQPGHFLIESSKRVGIDSTPPEARDQPWRFFIADNLAVSTAKPSQILRRLAQLQQQVDGMSALLPGATV